MAISFSSPINRDARARGAGVTAVLGPTNTGKTHLAIERMLGHSSGIIGLPLRLLAREVYNKIADRVGADAVALITGEEKIKPANPRYWVATVEAMPRDLDVAFLAVDEVQLGSDLERGHVFTDRMLHRRGREETLVLGAQTVRPMVERLLPGAHILSRPRLSTLTFAGEKKITRLPRRSAVVAFSAEEVYAIAELIRRQRGGAAVVLGALSPRTRNAQVALYQSGDVDYLVATDAIGMGLNLDVDHVAFASDRKFDGYQFRKLNPAELAQIAGRAGRATRDGTFGTTGRCPPFETELVQALESHSFEPLKLLQWRNADLDYSTLGALQASLAMTPNEAGLTRAPIAEDILVLEHAARDDDVREMAKTREAVERLWEVCQVPDYRKISPATHAELAMTLFGFLTREGHIPIDWFARQIDEADRTDGGIDALSTRIAHIRTWTFAANRPDWLADPEHWQDVTRAVEDKLSDALHERLTERFVDRRTSVLMRRMRENTGLDTDIRKTGEVVVEGHVIGRLDGFMFTPDASAAGSEAKTLAGAAQKALSGEIDARAARLAQSGDDTFVLATDGIIRWLGQAVGKLVAGDDMLKPRIRIVADEHLSGPPRDAVQVRLDLWLKTHIEKTFAPLFALSAAEDVTGIARGVAFQLVEGLGVLDRTKVSEDVKGLDQPSRAGLRKHGVRFGAYHLYVPILIKPAPRTLALQLYALKHDGSEAKGLETVERLAASGRTSIVADKEVEPALYRAAGYRICGERAVRVDILERIADVIRPALAWRPGAPGPKPPGAIEGFGFIVTNGMTSLAGCAGEDFASILRSLGYRMERRPKPVEPPQVAAQAAEPAETSAVASVEIQPADSAPSGAAGDAGSSGADLASEPVAAPEMVASAPAALAISQEHSPDATASPVATDADLGVPPAADLKASEEGAKVSEEATAASGDAVTAPEGTVETAKGMEFEVGAPATSVAEEPQFIEVWRPGRPEGQRRQRPPQRPREAGRRPDRRGGDTQTPAVAAATASDATASLSAEGTPAASDEATPAAAEGAPGPDQRRGRHRRHGRSDRGEHADRGDRPEGAQGERAARPEHRPDRPKQAEGAEAPERAPRPDHPPRGDRPPRADRPFRGDRPGGRGDRPGRGGGDRPERDPELRAKYIKGRNDGRDSRDKAPDPNSPFAKLAALKEQLEADSKERR